MVVMVTVMGVQAQIPAAGRDDEAVYAGLVVASVGAALVAVGCVKEKVLLLPRTSVVSIDTDDGILGIEDSELAVLGRLTEERTCADVEGLFSVGTEIPPAGVASVTVDVIVVDVSASVVKYVTVATVLANRFEESED
jgi:hypothetical protein